MSAPVAPLVPPQCPHGGPLGRVAGSPRAGDSRLAESGRAEHRSGRTPWGCDLFDLEPMGNGGPVAGAAPVGAGPGGRSRGAAAPVGRDPDALGPVDRPLHRGMAGHVAWGWNRGPSVDEVLGWVLGAGLVGLASIVAGFLCS